MEMYICPNCGDEMTVTQNLISINIDGRARACHRDCSGLYY